MGVEDTIRERAKAGARLLDLFDPTWAQAIDLNTLDLAQPSRCVLGQRGIGYLAALRQVLCYAESMSEIETPEGESVIGRKNQIRYGFEAPLVFRSGWTQDRYFEALTDAWTHEVLNRTVDR